MLWMNKTGAVGPLGSEVASVSVGGYSWHVYKGSNGSNQVFSFVNTGAATSGTVNILAVLRWIESQGWFGNITLGNVQFGWEITSASGGGRFPAKKHSGRGGNISRENSHSVGGGRGRAGGGAPRRARAPRGAGAGSVPAGRLKDEHRD